MKKLLKKRSGYNEYSRVVPGNSAAINVLEITDKNCFHYGNEIGTSLVYRIALYVTG